MLDTCNADNVKARRLLPDGAYVAVERQGEPVRAQEAFHREALAAVQADAAAPLQFRPLSRPDDDSRP